VYLLLWLLIDLLDSQLVVLITLLIVFATSLAVLPKIFAKKAQQLKDNWEELKQKVQSFHEYLQLGTGAEGTDSTPGAESGRAIQLLYPRDNNSNK
jgi:hypothetical protein